MDHIIYLHNIKINNQRYVSKMKTKSFQRQLFEIRGGNTWLDQ